MVRLGSPFESVDNHMLRIIAIRVKIPRKRVVWTHCPRGIPKPIFETDVRVKSKLPLRA